MTQIDLSDPTQFVLDGARDDLLICCASFESRSQTVVDRVHSSYVADKSIVYVNRELLQYDSNARNSLYKLVSNCARSSKEVVVAEGSLFDPNIQLDSLKTALGIIPNVEPKIKSVTVDVTTFNRESLLVLCGLLGALCPRPQVRVLYTSPATHGEWLSRGVRSVRNVIGYAGVRDPQLPTALILLSGFEHERAMKIVDEHEPAKLFVGVGDPPTAQQFLSRNVSEQRLLFFREDVERFSFSAGNVTSATHTLQGIVDRCAGKFNLVVAPMSTKLSTIAAFNLAIKNVDIQISYCVAGEYNVTDYSTGQRSIYVENLFVEQQTDES